MMVKHIGIMIGSQNPHKASAKQNIAFSFLLSCFLVSQAFAADKPAPKITVPGGNPNIYLRMPLKELLQQQKNARPFNFGSDSHSIPNPEVLTQTLIEDYEKNAQFQHGFYFVQEGSLLAIALFSKYPGKIPFERRQKLLSSLVKAYGQPDGATIVELGGGKHRYSSPAFFWHLPSVTIALAANPDEVNSTEVKESIVELKMYVPGYTKKAPFDLSNVTSQQRKNILAPLRSALKKVH